MLDDIVDAVGGSMKIFVDGGIRSWVDVFKALALGADRVLICRTFVTAFYGGTERYIGWWNNSFKNRVRYRRS